MPYHKGTVSDAVLHTEQLLLVNGWSVCVCEPKRLTSWMRRRNDREKKRHSRKCSASSVEESVFSLCVPLSFVFACTARKKLIKSPYYMNASCCYPLIRNSMLFNPYNDFVCKTPLSNYCVLCNAHVPCSDLIMGFSRSKCSVSVWQKRLRHHRQPTELTHSV